MHWLGAIIGGTLLGLAQSIVSRVLVALGIGAVSYTGGQAALDQLRTLVQAQFGALASDAALIAGSMGLGIGVNILLSAYLMRFTLMGLRTDGSIQRLFFKGK